MKQDFTNKELNVIQNALSFLIDRAIFNEFSLSCFDEDGNIEYFTKEDGETAKLTLEKLNLEYNR